MRPGPSKCELRRFGPLWPKNANLTEKVFCPLRPSCRGSDTRNRLKLLPWEPTTARNGAKGNHRIKGGGSKLFGGQASVSGAWLRFLVYAFLQSRMVPTLWSYRYGDTKCSLQDKADALARQAAATHLLHLRLCVLRRPRKPLASLETRNVRPRGDDVAQQLPGQATLQTETMRLVAGRERGMLLSCR